MNSLRAIIIAMAIGMAFVAMPQAHAAGGGDDECPAVVPWIETMFSYAGYVGGGKVCEQNTYGLDLFSVHGDELKGFGGISWQETILPNGETKRFLVFHVDTTNISRSREPYESVSEVQNKSFVLELVTSNPSMQRLLAEQSLLLDPNVVIEALVINTWISWDEASNTVSTHIQAVPTRVWLLNHSMD